MNENKKTPLHKPYGTDSVKDKPVSKIYGENDLLRDNMENDMSQADKQDL